MDSDLVLVIVVVTALAFDFTNGFHDTANVVATGDLDARAPAPDRGRSARRCSTSSARSSRSRWRRPSRTGSCEPDLITPTIVFAGLIGAIAWNLITWWFGLPSSSSHALIGGVVGAALAAEGTKALVSGGLLGKVIVPALIAPVARVRRRGARRSCSRTGSSGACGPGP